MRVSDATSSATAPLAGASHPAAPAPPGEDSDLSAAAPAGYDPAFPLPYRYDYPAQYSYHGHFPKGFSWGIATSSYQVEGALEVGGRGLSIWDTFTGADGGTPNPAMGGASGQTGSVSSDHYHKFKEDVALVKKLGLKTYRFSIAWPRILPNGTVPASRAVNAEGVDFYNALIDELLLAGIEPQATLYHWDLPQALLNDPARGYPSEYRGWLDERLPSLFAEYARVCFSAFGDRVKTWYTLEEPYTFAVLGHAGAHAPSLCNWALDGCAGGERPAQGFDVYTAGHHALLAHAAAARVYRSEFAPAQKGRVGIVLSAEWHEPATHSAADVLAAERANLFQLGWFADPIFGGQGDYPAQMRAALGERLPTLSAKQRAELNGSADVFGLSHFTSRLAFEQPVGEDYGTRANPYSHARDCQCGLYAHEGWVRARALPWARAVPWGVRKLLGWVHRRYAPQHVVLAKSGWPLAAEEVKDGLHDPERIGYLANYTSELRRVRAHARPRASPPHGARRERAHPALARPASPCGGA